MKRRGNKMSGLKFRRKHIVHTFECDVKKEMTLPALINIMVETSGLQSRHLGNTNEQMSERGLSWIIIQYDMQITQMPKSRETITIETEAISYNRFFTYRKFRAFDEADNILVEVLTTFAMMDIKTRKLTQIQEELVAPYQAEKIRTMIRAPKIQAVNLETASELPFRVRYLDIDGNNHVNNAKYFDWMINSIDLEILKNYTVGSVNIKYEKEVNFGNIINSFVSVEEVEKDKVMTVHHIENDHAIACRANITWVKRN